MKNLASPASVTELLERAHAIAGKTIAELAKTHHECVPHSLTFAKGWVGQFIEKLLGANAFNLDQPDFINLSIELKTIPMTPNGQPCESTYICTAPIPFTDLTWENSRVWRKVAKILWVPIETDRQKALSEQRIGTPILWSPNAFIAKQLREDWEELTEMITLGQFEKLSAHQGAYLQIRPKAPNAKTFIQVIDHQGELISTVPKGFYLRPALTQQIVHEYYVLV